jgi:hypothetical protein
MFFRDLLRYPSVAFDEAGFTTRARTGAARVNAWVTHNTTEYRRY